MKEKFLNSKLILLIPAYWACLFDEIITIINQSDAYWKGDLSKANEGNPIGAFVMAHHTSGLFIISALWLVLIGIIGYYLSDKKLKIFALFVLIVHSFGASTWLSQYYSFWYMIIFIFINAILFIEAESIYESRKKRI
jgi:MFS-type transporter involved in bile tolerance (Atg22 family)